MRRRQYLTGALACGVASSIAGCGDIRPGDESGVETSVPEGTTVGTRLIDPFAATTEDGHSYEVRCTVILRAIDGIIDESARYAGTIVADGEHVETITAEGEELNQIIRQRQQTQGQTDPTVAFAEHYTFETTTLPTIKVVDSEGETSLEPTQRTSWPTHGQNAANTTGETDINLHWDSVRQLSPLSYPDPPEAHSDAKRAPPRAMAYDDGTLYFVSSILDSDEADDNSADARVAYAVTAVDAHTGAVEWNVLPTHEIGRPDSHATFGSEVTVDDGTVYTVAAEGTGEGAALAFALDADTGEVDWMTEVDPPNDDPLVNELVAYHRVGNERMYVFSSGSGQLVALDKATGDRLWRLDDGGSAIFDGDRLYVARENEILALDPDTQEPDWTHTLEDGLGPAGRLSAVTDEYVLFSLLDLDLDEESFHKVRILDVDTGDDAGGDRTISRQDSLPNLPVGTPPTPASNIDPRPEVEFGDGFFTSSLTLGLFRHSYDHSPMGLHPGTETATPSRPIVFGQTVCTIVDNTTLLARNKWAIHETEQVDSISLDSSFVDNSGTIIAANGTLYIAAEDGIVRVTGSGIPTEPGIVEIENGEGFDLPLLVEEGD